MADKVNQAPVWQENTSVVLPRVSMLLSSGQIISHVFFFKGTQIKECIKSQICKLRVLGFCFTGKDTSDF